MVSSRRPGQCTVLVLLVVPMTLQSTGVDLLVRIGDFFPGSAGMVLLSGGSDSYPAVAAAAILLCWACGCWAAGVAVLRSRDAA